MENAAGGKAYPGKADFGGSNGTVSKMGDATKGTGAIDGPLSKTPKPVTGY